MDICSNSVWKQGASAGGGGSNSSFTRGSNLSSSSTAATTSCGGGGFPRGANGGDRGLTVHVPRDSSPKVRGDGESPASTGSRSPGLGTISVPGAYFQLVMLDKSGAGVRVKRSGSAKAAEALLQQISTVVSTSLIAAERTLGREATTLPNILEIMARDFLVASSAERARDGSTVGDGADAAELIALLTNRDAEDFESADALRSLNGSPQQLTPSPKQQRASPPRGTALLSPAAKRNSEVSQLMPPHLHESKEAARLARATSYLPQKRMEAFVRSEAATVIQRMGRGRVERRRHQQRTQQQRKDREAEVQAAATVQRMARAQLRRRPAAGLLRLDLLGAYTGNNAVRRAVALAQGQGVTVRVKILPMSVRQAEAQGRARSAEWGSIRADAERRKRAEVLREAAEARREARMRERVKEMGLTWWVSKGAEPIPMPSLFITLLLTPHMSSDFRESSPLEVPSLGSPPLGSSSHGDLLTAHGTRAAPSPSYTPLVHRSSMARARTEVKAQKEAEARRREDEEIERLKAKAEAEAREAAEAAEEAARQETLARLVVEAREAAEAAAAREAVLAARAAELEKDLAEKDAAEDKSRKMAAAAEVAKAEADAAKDAQLVATAKAAHAKEVEEEAAKISKTDVISFWQKLAGESFGEDEETRMRRIFDQMDLGERHSSLKRRHRPQAYRLPAYRPPAFSCPAVPSHCRWWGYTRPQRAEGSPRGRGHGQCH